MGDDHLRLNADELVGWIGNQAFMRIAYTAGIGHCAALLPAPDGTFSCSVYARRPQVCRDLERGSGACEGEILLKGDRPKRLLTMLV